MMNLLRKKEGQIALPFVLLVGGIVIELVIAGAIVSFFVSNSSLGERLSLRALAAANTGVYDAIEKISLNKEFASSPVEYEIDVSSDTVTVSVSREVDNTKNIYKYDVSSVAIARTRQRKVTAEVQVDQTTGQINLSSVKEESVQ